MKLNGTHQLLAYADDVNILGGSIHTLKENAEALVAATREIELEVNADKTKYSRTSIYRFSRGWRKQTMNAGKRLIRETTFFNKKSRTLSFASWQNFALIENMTFRDLRCFHCPRRLHFAHRKML